MTRQIQGVVQPVYFASTDTVQLTPPLKWAGGKRWLVPHLQAIYEGHRNKRLVEPFCGGLAIALGLQPQSALLNDVNPHLVNFYGQIRQGFQIDLPLQNDSDFYYQSRERFNELIESGMADSKEAAALFYYLNRTGFNGLCRFNRTGLYNVPFGRYKTINYCTDFNAYQELFKRWKFLSADFESLELDPNDFVYADPPYDVEFTQYAPDGFNWDDQQRLAEWLSKHPGPVVLSNQATPRILKLYRSLGFNIQHLDAPRRISCNGDRRKAREVLATRNI